MWEEIGRLQFEFLCARGLKPSHRLLDIGCGSLRGGIHAINYLETGNYYGLDINLSLIEGGRHELRLAGLTHRNPHLAVSDRFELGVFRQKFDYLLAHSVFTHVFANHIIRCLTEVREVLASKGQFFATFFWRHTACTLPLSFISLGEFRRNMTAILFIIHGMKFELWPNWPICPLKLLVSGTTLVANRW